MRLALSFVAIALMGCDAIGGIADLRTGDPTSTDGGSDAGTAGASDAATTPSRLGMPMRSTMPTPGSTPTLAPIPTCSGDSGDNEAVGLRITVWSSASDAYTGVTDNNNINVAVGMTYVGCNKQDSDFTLRAIPDNSDAMHKWDGAGCGVGRECDFQLQQPTSIDVYLQ